MKRTAVVTGANRGLGLECSRQLAQRGVKVIMTGRDAAAVRSACDRLREDGLDVEHHQLDVTDPGSIAKLASYVVASYGGADILINNAGIVPDDKVARADSTSLQTVREAMDVNVFGAWLMCQAFLPHMTRRNYGRIVNVSSGVAHLTTMASDGLPAYRLSKVCLNAVTRMLASGVEGRNILVNSVDPGEVRTRLGGAHAKKSVEDGADTIVWAAMLKDYSPRRRSRFGKILHRAVALALGLGRRNGMFFRNKLPVNWLLVLGGVFCFAEA